MSELDVFDDSNTAENNELVTVRVRNRRADSYHTNAETCQSVSDDTNTEEITKADAERRGLELCQWCDPDTDVDNSGYDRSYLDAATQADPDPVDEVVHQ